MSVFDWLPAARFGFRRGIVESGKLPIVTAKDELILDLLCKEGVSRPCLGKLVQQEKKISIERLYAWAVKDGQLVNVTSSTRDKFVNLAKEKD